MSGETQWPSRPPSQKRASAWSQVGPTITSASSIFVTSIPELTGKAAQEVLDRAGITCNRNQIPDDPRPPFVTSGLRLGTAAETTAGMREPEMTVVASLIARTLRHRDDETELAAVRGDVHELCKAFDPYPDGVAVS